MRPRKPGSSGSRSHSRARARNITVNAIAPGFIDTDMTRALEPSQVEALTREIPSGRLGSPADVAAAAVGLGRRTSQTVNVNGGLYPHAIKALF